MWPLTTMPAPTPVPRITPNTTDAPAAAPSVASDSAKRFIIWRRTAPRRRRGREKNWKRWGPYLSERQWAHGARGLFSRTAIAGITSRTITRAAARIAGARTDCSALPTAQCRLCFALALWNGQDPILKERLFGLTGSEGNHGEDVKECYYYLDSTPTHSYMKALYKYPQAEFPYARLVEENRRRGLGATGVRIDRHRHLR